MEFGESGGPERPEYLLIVVDVANIRPRDKSSRKDGKPTGPTSLAFIDLCLNYIQMAAPGAVVVKFADRSVLDALPKNDRAEMKRRNELHFSEPDKIYLVQYADRPVLAAAHLFEASIVSCDRFADAELEELKTAGVRQYRHLYDKAERMFSFPELNDGRPLDRWWTLEFAQVPEPWFVSDEYLEIDWQLRSKVHDETFAYHHDRLTHRPELPSLPLGSVVDSDHVPAERAVPVAPATPARPSRESQSRPVRRLPVVFAYELHEYAGPDVREARVVGRTERSAGGRLTVGWFAGGLSGRLIPASGGAPIRAGAWVSVPCRIEARDGNVTLEQLDDGEVNELTFTEVLAMREPAASRKMPRAAATTWSIPSFTRAFVQISRLRERRKTAPSPAPGTARLRVVPVFRDGQLEQVEMTLTDQEEVATVLEAERQLHSWKIEQAELADKRRREAEEERKRRDAELDRRIADDERRRRELEEKLVERRKRQEEERKRQEEERERLRREVVRQETVARRWRIMLVAAILFLLVATTVVLALAVWGMPGASASITSVVEELNRASAAGRGR